MHAKGVCQTSSSGWGLVPLGMTTASQRKRERMIRKFTLFVLAASIGYFATTDMVFGASAKVEHGVAARPATVAARGVPLYFEKNQGQTDGQVRFLARAGGYTAFLTGHETVLLYHNGKPGQKNGHDAVVRMSLAGSLKSATVEGGEQLPGIVNYMAGNDSSKWQTGIPTYAEVDSNGVYPGVDLAYRLDGKQLEFDFRVAPGASPDPIRMDYSGASKMHLNAAGDLILDTSAGRASILKPVAYQDADGKRVPVAVTYALLGGGKVAFHVGKYDRSRALVIDPTVGPSVWYSTYLGSGAGGEYFTSIAVDAAGEAFIAGYTSSAAYPTGALPGYAPYQARFNINYYNSGSSAGFVTALNSTGTGIIYSTYISGVGQDTSTGVNLNAIAVDAAGFAFVGGKTDDSTFPLLNAFQTNYPSDRNSPDTYTVGVVFELSQHGDSLIYSSFIGGGDSDSINGIAVDSSDNAYIAGTSIVGGNHISSNFPVTSGAIWGHFTQQNNGSGPTAAFASKIAPPSTGDATLAYSTLMGSANNGFPSTYGVGIAVDSSGDAYVLLNSNCDITDHGGTIATELNMTHVVKSQSQTVDNTIVIELNPAATAAVYVSFLGGSTPSTNYAPDTIPAGIAVDSTGKAYVAGTTGANNFQTTAGAYQTTKQLAGNFTGGVTISDAFVTIIAAKGASFAYSTYLNGTTLSSTAISDGIGGSPTIAGIALGTGGQFAISGIAATTNFPKLGSPAGNPLLTAFPGCPSSCQDTAAFITKFTTSGLVYSTFLGAGDYNENTINGIASNGTDMYLMIQDYANGLASGGAYNSNGSGNGQELVLRLQDAVAIPTTVTADAQTASFSTSAQAVSLNSSINAASTVNGGVVTYSLKNAGSTVIGSSVTSGIVSDGLAPTTSFTLPASTPNGTYTITASYDGAEDFLSSTGTASLVVSPYTGPTTTTAVTSSLNPSVYGQSVTFTATVSSASAAPTGTVQFKVDGVNLGGTVALIAVNGTSSAATSPATTTILVAGSPHTVLANFVNTTTTFANSSGTLSAGQTVTLAAQATLTVTGVPGTAQSEGTTFTVGSSGGSGTGAVTFAATGSCSVTGTTVTITSGTGICSVTATKATDGDYASATSAAVTVSAAPPGPATASAPVAANFGSLPATIAAEVNAVTFTFTGAGVIRTPMVLTQGAAGLDFVDFGTGTCDTNGASHFYSVGNTCTVNVTFAPQYAGPRHGAVLLEDGSGNILATAYIYGIGTGPQITFANTTSGSNAPAALSVLGSGFNAPAGVAVDGAGNVFAANFAYGNNSVQEILAAGG